MTTITIALADPRQVVGPWPLAPRVPSHGDLHSLRSTQEADAIACLRMQIIRNELVVTFHVGGAQIKICHIPIKRGIVSDNLNVLLVSSSQWGIAIHHGGLSCHLSQGLFS